MAVRTCLTYVTLICHIFLAHVTYETVLKIVTKKINYQKQEDYTFEGELNRASGECSYIFLVNDTANRNKTIEKIKEKAMNRKVKEFYETKEREKQKSKEFYENLEKESMRKILAENEKVQRRMEGLGRRGADGGGTRNGGQRGGGRRYKRLASESTRRENGGKSEGKGGPRGGKGRGRNRKNEEEDREERRRNRKGSQPSAFSTGTFTDHNNCSSRCIFARMELVNPLGYPDESLVVKLIDDRITNAKFRLAKKKKVSSCFNAMKKVAYVDSCIISAKLFDCLQLGESYLWSNQQK